MLVREKADELFQEGNLNQALVLYLSSIHINEPGQIYAHLHAGFVASIIKNYTLLTLLLINSFRHRHEDEVYFNNKIRLLLFRTLAFGDRDLAKELAQSVPIKPYYPNKKTEYLFILGFPRCGTTALASALEETGNFIGSLSDEPFTEMAEIENFEETISIWHHSLVANKSPDCNLVIEKSTNHLLSITNVRNLLENFPKSYFIVCKRDPFDRAISAFNFGHNQGGHKNLKEAAQIELDLINKYGIHEIFLNINIFNSFINDLMDKNIKLSIIYPSVLISRWDDFYSPQITSKLTFIELGKKNIFGIDKIPHLTDALQNMKSDINKSFATHINPTELKFVKDIIVESKNFLR